MSTRNSTPPPYASASVLDGSGRHLEPDRAQALRRQLGCLPFRAGRFGTASEQDAIRGPLLQSGDGGVLPGVLRGDVLGILRGGCLVVAAAQRDLPDERR